MVRVFHILGGNSKLVSELPFLSKAPISLSLSLPVLFPFLSFPRHPLPRIFFIAAPQNSHFTIPCCIAVLVHSWKYSLKNKGQNFIIGLESKSLALPSLLSWVSFFFFFCFCSPFRRLCLSFSQSFSFALVFLYIGAVTFSLQRTYNERSSTHEAKSTEFCMDWWQLCVWNERTNFIVSLPSVRQTLDYLVDTMIELTILRIGKLVFFFFICHNKASHLKNAWLLEISLCARFYSFFFFFFSSLLYDGEKFSFLQEESFVYEKAKKRQSRSRSRFAQGRADTFYGHGRL